MIIKQNQIDANSLHEFFFALFCYHCVHAFLKTCKGYIRSSAYIICQDELTCSKCKQTVTEKTV